MFHNIRISSCLIRVSCIFSLNSMYPLHGRPQGGGGARVGARLIPAIIKKKNYVAGLFLQVPLLSLPPPLYKNDCERPCLPDPHPF